MVTEAEVTRVVVRLKDFYSSNKDTQALVRAWMYVLDGENVDSVDLNNAAREMMREGGRFMPNAGQVLQRAKQMRGSAAATIARMDGPESNPNAACPTCGAVLRPLEWHEQINTYWDGGALVTYYAAIEGAPPRYGFLHDAQKHRRAGTDMTGYWK